MWPGYVNTLGGPPDLSDLNALKEAGTTIGERYLGQSIVKYGVYGKVSACQSCHGYNGRGAAPVFPVIGQQKYTYLVTQLNSWRDGSRANDPVCDDAQDGGESHRCRYQQHRHLPRVGADRRPKGIRSFP